MSAFWSGFAGGFAGGIASNMERAKNREEEMLAQYRERASDAYKQYKDEDAKIDALLRKAERISTDLSLDDSQIAIQALERTEGDVQAAIRLIRYQGNNPQFTERVETRTSGKTPGVPNPNDMTTKGSDGMERFANMLAGKPNEDNVRRRLQQDTGMTGEQLTGIMSDPRGYARQRLESNRQYQFNTPAWENKADIEMAAAMGDPEAVAALKRLSTATARPRTGNPKPPGLGERMRDAYEANQAPAGTAPAAPPPAAPAPATAAPTAPPTGGRGNPIRTGKMTPDGREIFMFPDGTERPM